MNFGKSMIAGVVAISIVGQSSAATVETQPAQAGMSAERLEQLTEAADKAVASGVLSGAVAIVYRKDKLAYVSARGYQDLATKTPMRRDTIFAMASMTKPVTAVAAMILIEDGKLRLDEPVDRWLPELANRNILDDPKGPLTSAHASPRPITVRDLLTYRMGIGATNFAGIPDDAPIGKAFVAASAPGSTADEYMARIGALPLIYAPGERFMYNTPSIVLGVLISRVSGMPYDQFVETRIFRPLGIKDSGFFVPAAKQGRVATVYAPDKQGKLVATGRKAPTAPPAFPNAAGDLYSTADDYMTFARMLLGGGKLGRVRILSERSVDMMTTDYLTKEAPNSFFIFPNFFANAGFGFGLEVQTKQAPNEPSPGSYWWSGSTGVTWTADPKEQMIFVRLIQNMAPPTGYHYEFMSALYGAIER